MSRPPALLGLLLALALLVGGTGASDLAGRYGALSHQTMCTCGCAQILGECNHVGCPNSTRMLRTLHTDLAGGMSDHAVLVAFAQEYGPTALASPLLTRFNETAWVVPPAVLILGLLLAVALLRRWRDNAGVPVERGPALTGAQTAALARVRRDTEEL